jgi:cytochrome b561
MTAATTLRYNRVAVLLHWVISLLIIYMVLFGEGLMDRNASDASGATWHASIGIAILVLSVARLIWRLANPPPPLPEGIKRWESTLSKIVVVLFYALMILLPLTGLAGFAHFVTRVAAAGGATVFGLFPVPQFTLGAGWDWGDLHGLMGKAMYPLIGLHILGVLKHTFMDDTGVLRRMT